MADYVDIIGVGDTQANQQGTAVTFVLETAHHGPLNIRCPSPGLKILIASLTALLQEAISRGIDQGESEKRIETIPIEQVGCGPAANSLDVILSPVLPSGSMLNFSVPPQLANQLAEQLSASASTQLSKKN